MSEPRSLVDLPAAGKRSTADPAPGRRLPRRALAPVLLAVALLAMLSIACSVGSSFTSRSTGGATPTKTRRATFTPLPGALNTPSAGGPLIRGTLPPGVAAPGASAAVSDTVSALGGGDTSMVIFATDTPTPSPTPTLRPPTSTPVESIAPERGPAKPTPYVVIQPATLNGRRGPGTEYERIGQAKQGEQLFILGRTADGKWLQVCCMANQPVWVAADQVKAEGALELASVVTPAPTPLPTATRAPVVNTAPRTNQSPLPTPGPVGTPLPPFDIARGPEFPITRDNGLMTIWAKVYEGPADNQTPLGGYILKVIRDGVDVSDHEVSFGDRAFDNTGKFQGDYDYNLKFELNDASDSDYEIYLARPGGFRVSPITKFTTKGTSYRTLVVYMAYWLAR